MTKKTDALDLSALDTVAACDKGARIELRHPVTSEALGVFITVLGKDSQAFRDHLRTAINERLRKEALAKKRGREPDVMTVEVGEAEAIDLLVVCTVGWEGVTYKGQPLEFNVPNAKTLYADLPWVRKQIDEAIGDLENFMTS